MRLFLSNFGPKCVKIITRERSSFAKIIHQPDSCDTSTCWLNSMIFAHVTPGLLTLKDHSDISHFILKKTYIFDHRTLHLRWPWLKMRLCLFWRVQTPSKYLVWPPFAPRPCDTSALHRCDQVVDIDPWNVSPLFFNGCVKLLWYEQLYMLIQSVPNMLKCELSMQAMQELGCFQLPGTVHKSLLHVATIKTAINNVSVNAFLCLYVGFVMNCDSGCTPPSPSISWDWLQRSGPPWGWRARRRAPLT